LQQFTNPMRLLAANRTRSDEARQDSELRMNFGIRSTLRSRMHNSGSLADFRPLLELSLLRLDCFSQNRGYLLVKRAKVLLWIKIRMHFFHRRPRLGGDARKVIQKTVRSIKDGHKNQSRTDIKTAAG
jgi:hypothetical protein